MISTQKWDTVAVHAIHTNMRTLTVAVHAFHTSMRAMTVAGGTMHSIYYGLHHHVPI